MASASTIVDELPSGAVTEILGDVSSGKTTVVRALLAVALRSGGYAAWVDLPNAFDPRSARDAGIDLDRLLWIAPADEAAAIRAAEQVLNAGGFRIVVLDFGDSGLGDVRFSTAVWLRMNRAAAIHRVAIVVLDTVHVARCAAVSLEVHASHRIFVGEGSPCPMFEGAAIALQLRMYKGGCFSERPLQLFASAKD